MSCRWLERTLGLRRTAALCLTGPKPGSHRGIFCLQLGSSCGESAASQCLMLAAQPPKAVHPCALLLSLGREGIEAVEGLSAGGSRAAAAADIDLPVYCISARDAQVTRWHAHSAGWQGAYTYFLQHRMPCGLGTLGTWAGESAVRAEPNLACSLPQKLEGRCRKDGPVGAFSRLEHTEVPALRGHVHDIARRGRIHTARSLAASLSSFLVSTALLLRDQARPSRGGKRGTVHGPELTPCWFGCGRGNSLKRASELPSLSLAGQGILL